MVGTHRADIHRLDASYPAVIFQLDAREITQGIGHAMAAEPLKLLAVQLLTGDYLTQGGPRHDHHLTHTLYGVQSALRHYDVTHKASHC